MGSRLTACTQLFLLPPSLDYSTGFGGKYGVQKDSQDSSAVGWDHQEHLAKHDSQKGKYDNPRDMDVVRAPGPVVGMEVVSAPDRSLSVHQTTRCQCTR